MEKETRRLDFIDNRDGNSLAAAIQYRLKQVENNNQLFDELWIASAFFSPSGFDLLVPQLDSISSMRLMLGVEPKPEYERDHREVGDPREPEFTRRRVEATVNRQETGLRRDRDLLPFSPYTEQVIKRLIEFLRSGRIEVRRYKKDFLHAKAYLFRGSERSLFAGSSNLTRSGLKSNMELNLGIYDDPLVGKVESWYEDLWEIAEPFNLAAIYEEMLKEYSPYLIYLKVLWELYGSELQEEADPSGHVPVTTFQKHGVWRARRILKEYGGVLIADGVGLGKTFTAGEIIQLYRDQRQRVLLICPASLRDSTWQEFLNRFQLMVDSVSYEELANDTQLGGAKRHLKNPIDEYSLIVIDEAHNYRNPDAPKRAGVLRQLLRGRAPDLVLLSATPVNNSLWDLYHILRYFIRQDAQLARKHVLSIRERFEQAMSEDPFDLNPDILYPVIDATTVKRTRQFVKKHYSHDAIRGPDGALITIKFPHPIPQTINYDLEDELPGFFERFEEALAPQEGHPLLTMARYKPERYRYNSIRRPEEDSALAGLLRSAMLKRFESSAYSFNRTVQRMLDEHKTFLSALKKGKVINKEFVREWSAADEDLDFDEYLELSDETEDATQFDAESLESDIEGDIELLKEFIRETKKIKAENDPKLQELVSQLKEISAKANRDAIDEESAVENRKVLIFTSYADTVTWIYEFLKKHIRREPGLENYKGRIAAVGGRDDWDGISREDAVFGFAPISSGAPRGSDLDRFDILVTTDVLAEGLNLQQCRNVINYDLPWNPMRLVQRHGRIDRIGSRHDEVFLRTFFPDRQLDALLNLEERIRVKLARAAASVGVETAPIENALIGTQSFSETRDEIEKLRRNDPEIYELGGTVTASQTGEEYRHELRKALESFDNEIKRVPWKAGSGHAHGVERGHFFCAKIDERVFLRFVPFDHSKEVESELGACLRSIECSADTPRVMPDDLASKVFDSWERAKSSIKQAWDFETDPKNLQPKVRRLNKEVAEFIREHPPTEYDEEQVHRALDTVEAPWSRREENLLRKVFNDEWSIATERSNLLIKCILDTGVPPFKPAEPLPPIEDDEISLICWMAIEAKQR